MGIIQGREEGVAVRGMYPTQQGPAFIRPFMRFLTGLLLLVGLVMLASSRSSLCSGQERALLEGLERRWEIIAAHAALETSLSIA